MHHVLRLSVSPCMRRWCQLAMPTSRFSLTGSLDISTFRLSTSKYQPTCLPLASTPPSHLPHVTPLVCLTLLCDMSLTHSHPQYHRPHLTWTLHTHLTTPWNIPHTLLQTQHPHLLCLSFDQLLFFPSSPQFVPYHASAQLLCCHALHQAVLQ